jgi:hypothetical protein
MIWIVIFLTFYNYIQQLLYHLEPNFFQFLKRNKFYLYTIIYSTRDAMYCFNFNRDVTSFLLHHYSVHLCTQISVQPLNLYQRNFTKTLLYIYKIFSQSFRSWTLTEIFFGTVLGHLSVFMSVYYKHACLTWKRMDFEYQIFCSNCSMSI